MPKNAALPDSKREHAYRSLRRLLVLQQLQPGERIREPQWARQLKVHRSALREAFARLEAEGLIERGPKTGYFVPTLTPDDVQEITKLRLALECLAIDEICRAERPVSLHGLRDAVAELKGFLKRSYSLGVIEADRRFHESLIDLAGMRRLSMLYHRAPLPLIHSVTESEENWRRETERTLAEHKSILAAIKSRNAERAKRALRQHLNQRSILPMCH
jgi:DNA-binding GntR family transcriptional regulator